MPPRKRKKPTAAEDALNALLGLSAKAEEVSKSSTGNFYGVSEAEIQNFRQAQGLIYFLQAPALFQAKTCKHCEEHFLVSRLFVAYCSYTCIRKELNKFGLDWHKGNDIEEVITDVYEGNEPIWIREPQLEKALEVLTNLLQTAKPSDEPTPSSVTQPVRQDVPSSSTMEQTEPSLSPPTTITPSSSSIPGTTLSRKKRPSRSITFG